MSENMKERWKEKTQMIFKSPLFHVCLCRKKVVSSGETVVSMYGKHCIIHVECFVEILGLENWFDTTSTLAVVSNLHSFFSTARVCNLLVFSIYVFKVQVLS